MKKIFALLLALVCLLASFAFAETETESENPFLDDCIGRMNFICEQIVKVGGGEAPYTTVADLAGVAVRFSNDEETLTCMLMPDETGLAIGSGMIYTTDPDLVRNAMNTLCMLAIIDSELRMDGIAVAAWFDEHYDSVLEIYNDPDLQLPEDITAPVHTQSFTGDNGLSATMSTFVTESDIMFTIDFAN